MLPTVEIPVGVPTFNWDDYRVDTELGRGATGSASKVVNISSGEFFTMKRVFIIRDELNDKRHREAIKFDMSLATSVDHPNIMKCLGVSSTKEQGIHFLYNWMPCNLNFRKIKRMKTLAVLALQVLLALDYLRKEKGFVFKHLTPGNILLDPSRNLVKITDVGIVKDKYIILSCVTSDEERMKYIAPENFHYENQMAELQSDPYRKSDVWSLGLCLLQFYYGNYPFDDDNGSTELKRHLLSGFGRMEKQGCGECDVWPPRPPSDAPPFFREFISACLQLDVSQRADVDQLLTHNFITCHFSIPRHVVGNTSDLVVSKQGHTSDDTKNVDAPETLRIVSKIMR